MESTSPGAGGRYVRPMVNPMSKFLQSEHGDSSLSTAAREEGLKLCSFRIFHGPLASQTLQACEKNISQDTTEVTCCGGTTPKTTVKTAQYVRSKEHQFRKWQQQHSWIQFADRQRCSVGLHARASVRSLQIIVIAREGAPPAWKSLPPNRRPTQWDSIEEPVGPLARDLYDHPPAAWLWVRRFEELLIKQNLEKYQHGDVFIENLNGSCPCMKTTSKWLGRKNTWDRWKKIDRSGNPTPY